MIGIYTCNPSTHQPFFTDWSQVGGKPGGIVRYAPQAGSGTLSFFQTKLLNGGTVDQNCDSSHLATRLEEHDARGVSTVTFQNAIYMYDWARFRAQKGGFEPNLTNGAVLGKYGTTRHRSRGRRPPNVNETKSRYDGTRYVYNVVRKTPHPASDKFQLNDITRSHRSSDRDQRWRAVHLLGQGGGRHHQGRLRPAEEVRTPVVSGSGSRSAA